MTPKKPLPSEDAEQAIFVQWFRMQYPGVLIFSIPNGGYRHITVAQKMKQTGQVKGIPDLCIPAWRVYVEMKRTKGGTVSKEQREILDYLEGCGYTVAVCKGFEAARDFVLSLPVTK